MGRHKHGCGRWRHDLAHDLDLTQADLDPGGSISLLKYLTRLLFLTILSSAAVVLVVSVMMLTHCRGQVKVVEDVVMNSHALCTHLPIPAYFACVVIVVTIFGFGCVGRKVSGLLLIGVSVVAMVIAIVVVVSQECVEDVQNVHKALVVKLEQCGLAPGLNSSSAAKTSLHHTQELHRFEYLADLQLAAECRNVASSLTTLCRQFFTVDSPTSDSDRDGKPGQPINQTGVETCAQHVSHSMYSLCMQDTEIVYPILLTLPIFYMGIGVALVYIKHADVNAKSSVYFMTRNSVGTNTERSASSPESGYSRRRALSLCVSSLCFRHSLCFTCLLRGEACPCCSTASTPLRPSSRQSYQLREVKGGEKEREEDGEDEEEEIGVPVQVFRRASAPCEPHEQLGLIEECV